MGGGIKICGNCGRGQEYTEGTHLMRCQGCEEWVEIATAKEMEGESVYRFLKNKANPGPQPQCYYE